MRELTDDEKGYLRIAYEDGYRYVATDKIGGTYFYEAKPNRQNCSWYDGTAVESLVNFGTSWSDKAPTKIADLLGIDTTDWSQVAPFTPVWVREDEHYDWDRAYFLRYNEDCDHPFDATCCHRWSFDDSYEDWKYCRLATQEEIDEVIASHDK